jgi:hypothetical protein
MTYTAERHTRVTRDEATVRDIAERLAVLLGRPQADVELTVRDELAKWRAARIQTFVPIVVERAARQRLST